MLSNGHHSSRRILNLSHALLPCRKKINKVIGLKDVMKNQVNNFTKLKDTGDIRVDTFNKGEITEYIKS
jgi:hypothetical protein